MYSTAEMRFYGVMVSTQDSESCDPSSNLGRTLTFFSHGKLEHKYSCPPKTATLAHLEIGENLQKGLTKSTQLDRRQFLLPLAGGALAGALPI